MGAPTISNTYRRDTRLLANLPQLFPNIRRRSFPASPRVRLAEMNKRARPLAETGQFTNDVSVLPTAGSGVRQKLPATAGNPDILMQVANAVDIGDVSHPV